MNDEQEKTAKRSGRNPTLEEMGGEYPELMGSVRRELAEILEKRGEAALPLYLRRLSSEEAASLRKLKRNRHDHALQSAARDRAAKSMIARLAVKQHMIAAATGIESGKVRFNLLNGFVAQKLLFADGLVRKPVSTFWFRILWPLLWQRRLLMPLVQPKGIYCFYSKCLIDSFVELARGKKCLEIAAGDGTLSRFLSNAGLEITATDDYSWDSEITYVGEVIRQEARTALREYNPEVVFCSWPPAGNPFERQVFRTRSVQLYIVIASRHRFAAGNWSDYQEESGFEFCEDKRLSSLVLPPELDAAVYLFRRKGYSG